MANISIIGNEKSGKTSLASKLGKKGTESDLVLYNFVKGDKVYAFVETKKYPESPKSLIQAINLSDIVLLCVPSTGIDYQTGECIVALDLLENKKGLFVITKSDLLNPFQISQLSEKIKILVKNTYLENWNIVSVSTTTFKGMDILKEKIFAIGDIIDKENSLKDELRPRILIDHFFNVRGIGCVVLGTVIQGKIHIHDKLMVYPIKRNIEIRSIQSNDVDIKTANAGKRVGLALKGIQSKEFERGYVISEKEEISSHFILKSRLSKFTYPLNKDDVIHLFSGLQSVPAKIEKIEINGNSVNRVLPGSECKIALNTQKEIAYSSNDRFLIVQLNNPKQRFVAGCDLAEE